MRHTAIRNLYPQVTVIDDSAGCFDDSGNSIVIDEQAVQVEVDRLNTEYEALDYQRKRAAEYPDFKIYLDGVVKGDQSQIQAYIDTCLAVKRRHPKP